MSIYVDQSQRAPKSWKRHWEQEALVDCALLFYSFDFTHFLFCILFLQLTDVLLYTTPVGGNQYKLNKMLPLLGMQVRVV